MKKIVVAIDGFSSTGKSTLARQLAHKLGYVYIDSGAMYRAITLYFLRNQADLDNVNQVKALLDEIELRFEENEIVLNEEVLGDKIRTMDVSNLVSEVSAIKEVREFAVAEQQRLGMEKGIVMDGRDIGTFVFPQAELKIYLSAEEDTRVHRRYDEMRLKNTAVSVDEVRDNLRHRDHIDSTREVSPLRKADDAIVLDNTKLSMNQQLDIAYKWAQERMVY